MESLVLCENYDYSALSKLIYNMCGQYKFVKSFVIGKSCAGRDITALKIGNATEYALITAAIHGSEHITTNVLMMFFEELCNAVSNDLSIAGLNARRALIGRGIILIPRVNPDGCEISINGALACGNRLKEITKMCNGDFEHFNANLRGVDLNHNFDAGWKKLRELERENGIYGPSSRRYGGPSPESEPETKALCKLCHEGAIRQVLSLHTQGEVIYWSYGKNRPKRSQKMAEIMASSAEYALDVPTGLALGGGFKDWFIDCFDRPGFTAELGLGNNPLPIKQSREIYLRVREMLTLFSIM